MNGSLTDKELRKLPLRAIVGLCARGAARFRADFDLPGNISNRAQIMAAVDAAIRLACDFAADKPNLNNVTEIANAAMSAAGEAPPEMFGIAATKAGFAAVLIDTINSGQTELVPARATMCVSAGGERATAIRMDYDKLLNLNLGKWPELGSPIDVSANGPLGPL